MNDVAALFLYFTLVAVSALFLYMARKYRESRGIFWVLITLAVAIPATFFCLKYTTLHNADYGRYIIVSENYSRMGFLEYLNLDAAYKMETSFWLMSKITWALSSGPFLMFAMYYIFTFIFFLSGIVSSKKLSPFRSAIVYVFFLATIIPLGISGVRSLLSISILYFATVNLLNGKNKYFILLAILAGLIHNLSIVASVVIYGIFRLFRKKQISWRMTIAMLIIPPILLFIFLSLFTYDDLLNFIGWIPVLSQYQDYQSVLQLSDPILSSSSIITYNVLRSVSMAALLACSVCVYFATTKKEDAVINTRTSRLLILSGLGITLGSITFVGRVSSFLTPLLIMAIYDLVPENNRTSRYLTPIILLYSTSFFIVFVFIANHTGFFPLHFIWEADK